MRGFGGPGGLAGFQPFRKELVGEGVALEPSDSAELAHLQSSHAQLPFGVRGIVRATACAAGPHSREEGCVVVVVLAGLACWACWFLGSLGRALSLLSCVLGFWMLVFPTMLS